MDCPKLLVRVEVDGRPVDAILQFKEQYDRSRNLGLVVRGPKMTAPGMATYKPMKFTKIETSKLISFGPSFIIYLLITISASNDTPLDQLKKDIVRLSSVGEIIVHVHQQERGMRQAPNSYKATEHEHQNDFKVDEKALKGQAKSHETRYCTL
jgi:hypothetical protein